MAKAIFFRVWKKRSKDISPAKASPFISNLKKLLANTMPMRFGAYPWRTLRIPNVWKWESSWTKCRSWRVTDMADGMAVLEAIHPLAGGGLQFAVKVLDVHEPSEAELESMEDDGSASLVPPFLRLADKIVSEDDDDDTPYEAADGESADPYGDGSSMAKLAKPPRIVR